MLIVNERSLLNDGRIDENESLAKIKEENTKLVEKFRMQGQDELEKAERAWGPRMPYQELVRRIQRLNVNIKVVDGAPGNIAIYVLKTNQEMAEYASEPDDPTRYEWYKAFKYVTGCPKESLPEYSTVTVDERGLPKREVRGWRSILIALVKSRAITFRQAIEEFGNPDTDTRSNRFFEQLQSYR
jgi:hypothetical protein